MTYLGDLDNDGAVDGFDAIIVDLINNDTFDINMIFFFYINQNNCNKLK